MPLDFSIWERLAATVYKTEPRNGNDLIKRLEEAWHDVLYPPYVTRTCHAALERLRHIVNVKGGCLMSIDVADKSTNEYFQANFTKNEKCKP